MTMWEPAKTLFASSGPVVKPDPAVAG